MEGIRNVLKATLSAVAVASTIALIGCVNPIAVPKSPAAEKPAVVAETVPLVGTTTVIDKDNYALEFLLPESSDGKASIADGRSLVNYEDTGDAFQKAIDYYQLVLVDDAAKDKIWTSVSATGAAKVLSVIVKPRAAYHFLLLHGHKGSDDTPVLLGSGYLKYKIVTGENTVIIRMVPMLIDATLKGSAQWPITKNIGWVKNENFDVTIKLYSRSAGQDSTAAPHGNALWPLLLAQAAWSDSMVWDQFTQDMPANGIDPESPSYHRDEDNWSGLYWDYDGETMTSPLNLAAATTATVTAYTSPRSSSDQAGTPQPQPDSIDSTGQTTTGTLEYKTFTSLGPDDATIDKAKYGKFSFGLSYVPFGITDATIWQAAFGESFTEAPQWKIGGDVYLTYRLYGKDAAHGGLPAGAPVGVPAGLSWKTAASDAETFALAGAAYDQDAEYREIWLDATAHDTVRPDGSETLMDALTLLDKTLAAKPDAGNAKYVISVPVNANAAVPSMKLTAAGTSDYTTGDSVSPGLTFANLGALKSPLSISITGPSTGSGTAQPVLALSEKGSMFWLDKLNVPVTMTIDNVTLQGLSATGHSIPASSPAIDNNQALVYVETGNTFEMLGSAKLTGNYNAGISTGTTAEINASKNGGAARVSGGTFLMTGENALISGNTASGDGGGVECIDGNFTMKAGEISGNSSSSDSSHLHQFAMSGGGIQKFAADVLGVVYVNGFRDDPNDQIALTDGALFKRDTWYGNQNLNTVIKVDSTSGGGTSPATYTVTNLQPQSASGTNHGYLTINGSTAQTVGIAADAEVTVVATPEGSYAAGTITCTTAGGVNVPITNGKFTMPAANVTVDVTFVLTTYTVTNAKPQSARDTNHGYLTVNGNGDAQIAGIVAGTEVTVVATANEKYGLKTTITCTTAGGATVPITGGKFTMPAEDVRVNATFTDVNVGW
jgi:hypothetical protein